jgi:hypothetical protein
MKRLIIILAVLAMTVAPAFAFDPAEPALSSGEKTADATILTGAGYFKQIIVMPDGTNDVTVSIYDNTASSGTEILPTLTFAGDGGPQASPPVWVSANTGIRVDVTTAGTVAYVVLYRGK